MNKLNIKTLRRKSGATNFSIVAMVHMHGSYTWSINTALRDDYFRIFCYKVSNSKEEPQGESKSQRRQTGDLETFFCLSKSFYSVKVR